MLPELSQALGDSLELIVLQVIFVEKINGLFDGAILKSLAWALRTSSETTPSYHSLIHFHSQSFVSISSLILA
jgi:hypothetical protein